MAEQYTVSAPLWMGILQYSYKILLMNSYLFRQPGLRSIWEKYYEEAHAVVYVIDAACPSRFEDSKSALGMLPLILRLYWIVSLFL